MTWATSVPMLVFLGLSVLKLGPMYATHRRQTKASLNASANIGRRHNTSGRAQGTAYLPSRTDWQNSEIKVIQHSVT